SRYRHDADFDWDKMMAHFGPGAEAYRVAADIARSDPDVHRAACELWLQIMYATDYKRESPYPAFDKAKTACERAVEASPADGRSSLQQALVHSTFAFLVSNRGDGGSDDPLPFIEEAIARAREAVRKNPEDSMAYYVLGNASWADTSYLVGRG